MAKYEVAEHQGPATVQPNRVRQALRGGGLKERSSEVDARAPVLVLVLQVDRRDGRHGQALRKRRSWVHVDHVAMVNGVDLQAREALLELPQLALEPLHLSALGSAASHGKKRARKLST
jgi:hypothetical protein